MATDTAVQLAPTQMTPRHITWTAMMGMQRSQSILGMPSGFIYSRPAQESNHRKTVNQRFSAGHTLQLLNLSKASTLVGDSQGGLHSPRLPRTPPYRPRTLGLHYT